MADISHGPRRKTRHKLRRNPREKTTITQRIQEFDEGDHVTITIDPSIHDGMPHPRFHGATGVITEQRGDAYVIAVETETEEKQVIAHPAHLTGGDTQ